MKILSELSRISAPHPEVPPFRAKHLSARHPARNQKRDVLLGGFGRGNGLLPAAVQGTGAVQRVLHKVTADQSWWTSKKLGNHLLLIIETNIQGVPDLWPRLIELDIPLCGEHVMWLDFWYPTLLACYGVKNIEEFEVFFG